MSEQNPFGLNILDRNVNVSRAYDYMAQAQPAMTLVYNNVIRAQGIKGYNPSMHVVHRQHNANDHQWHTVTSPLEWFTAHQAHGAGGVIVQCYNEPLASDLRVVDFMLGVWKHAREVGVHIVGPNYSVGNPNEKRIEAGDYDALIREVATNPYAWLGLHEYTKGNPEAEYPWLIGRHVYWYARAEKLGLKLTRVLITEHGLDMGGGPEDGWRNQGISGQQYADMLIRARSLSPYRPPVAIFGFGDGFGWSSFNCDDPDFLSTVKAYREPVEDTVDIVYTEGYVVSVPQTFVNVRNEPSTSADIVDQLGVGERVNYADKFAEADGYRWQQLDIGWVTVWNLTRDTPMAVLAPYTVPALEFGMPMDWEYMITGYFKEPRDYGPHEGVDFVPYWGVGVGVIDVLSVAEGVVEASRHYEQSQAQGKLTTGYGNYIRVRYDDRGTVYRVWYCHLFHVYAKVGAEVFRGQVIGTIGSTGNSTAEHLHITVQQEGAGETLGGLPNVVNPSVILDELA